MKNHNDPIGNRTRDLPACSAVPQPTASSRIPPPGLTLKKLRILQMEFTHPEWNSEQTATCALYDNDNLF
jgi:hypothetical protein